MKDRIYGFISNTEVINTHSHHLQDNFYNNFDLYKLLEHSYVAWCNVNFDKSLESRINYLNKVRYKSYFIWINKSINKLYGFNEKLNVDNWDKYSNIINDAYKQKSWHKTILKENCKYNKVIIDAYWNPGSNNGDKELFTSTFRIDPLLFGFDKNIKNHDGNNAYSLYGCHFNDIDSYVSFIKQLIKEKIDNGCVALKCAIAYDRNLSFKKTSKQLAQKVFDDNENITKKEITDFQNYIFYKICEIAALYNVPIQCHTGLGCMEKTNAINMLDVIRDNPNTKFILFHGSFPWSDDVVGLLHSYQNVYVDICWLPILSPTLAELSLHQLIEVGTSDKICWGCDTWTSEESYGARLALNHVLSNVLFDKIQKDYLDINDAQQITRNILYNNSKKLYNL